MVTAWWLGVLLGLSFTGIDHVVTDHLVTAVPLIWAPTKLTVTSTDRVMIPMISSSVISNLLESLLITHGIAYKACSLTSHRYPRSILVAARSFKKPWKQNLTQLLPWLDCQVELIVIRFLLYAGWAPSSSHHLQPLEGHTTLCLEIQKLTCHRTCVCVCTEL